MTRKLSVVATDADTNLKEIISTQQKIVKAFQISVKEGEKSSTLKLLSTMKQIGLGWNKTSLASDIGLGQILCVIRDSWEELPEKFLSQYQHSFDRFIQEVYMMSPGKAHSLEKIWEALVSGKYVKFPDELVYSLSKGRLEAAATLVLKGKKINKEILTILSDSNLTNKQVYSKLFGKNRTFTGKKKKTTGHTQISSSTGELRVITPDNKLEMIGYLNYTKKAMSLFGKSAIQRIIKNSRIEIVP